MFNSQEVKPLPITRTLSEVVYYKIVRGLAKNQRQQGIRTSTATKLYFQERPQKT